MLSALGLPRSGTKVELVQRLLAAGPLPPATLAAAAAAAGAAPAPPTLGS